MFKAKEKESGEIVALKIVRLDEDDEVSTGSCIHCNFMFFNCGRVFLVLL